MVGDKWTLLIVRELASGPRRTMEIHSGLFPISSRTLVARLRDMERDQLLERTDFGGNPPHIEYSLTERGLLLLPIVDALRLLGQSLDCNECEDRKKHLGFYCEACPKNSRAPEPEEYSKVEQPRRRPADDSIVLL
jgi:DNA-binding HxlR family transcriptional regulator